MKLSIETKVGMAVASMFTALTVGVMGQGQSGGQTGGLIITARPTIQGLTLI